MTNTNTTVTIDSSSETKGPTLEEQAAALKIDPATLDSSAQTQEAPAKVEAERSADATVKTDAPADTGADTGADTEATTDAPTEGDGAEDQAREVTKAAGLDYDALNNKYWEKGELEDADYEVLEKAGIPRDIVDQYVAGQEAINELRAEKVRLQVFTAVGGEASYGELTAWAAENLTEAEIAAYDKAVNGDDTDVILLAVSGLKARYDAKVGFEPARAVEGTATKGQAVFRSISELKAAMNDPRYWNDPAYRQDVENKLARSDIM